MNKFNIELQLYMCIWITALEHTC